MNKPMRVRKAVFPVAGLGTRFLPATKTIPKEMLTIVDRPALHYAVDEARAAGIEEFIFVTGRCKGAIEDYFDYALELEEMLQKRAKIEALSALESTLLKEGTALYTRQQEPKGLGHAVWCARHLVENEPFAVIIPDDLIDGPIPCLKQMIEVFEEVGGNVVATMEVPLSETGRYGIVAAPRREGRLQHIEDLVEKPAPEAAPSRDAIIGRYILQPEIFDVLERQAPGVGGEIQLTDAMRTLLKTQSFYGWQFEGERLDCGTGPGWIAANIILGWRTPEMREAIEHALSHINRS